MFIAKLNMKTADIVRYSANIQKELKKLPQHIAEKLKMWAKTVNYHGIAEARLCKGYHDEPLKGERKGQRSIRLSKAYRAFYIEDKDTITITVIEVNKHEY